MSVYSFRFAKLALATIGSERVQIIDALDGRLQTTKKALLKTRWRLRICRKEGADAAGGPMLPVCVLNNLIAAALW